MRHDLHHIGRCIMCGNWTYKDKYCQLHLDTDARLASQQGGAAWEAQAAASPANATAMSCDIHKTTHPVDNRR